MADLFPSEATRQSQSRAADPSASAWVSANAGSGKTYVLANRVMRLLLSGVAPSRILCLTFTRAAAAHMSNTVFRRLSVWATLPDDALAEALTDIGEAPDAALLRRARKLFARALDTPGGLKVMTIHAFCERLLHQFPFEARVAAAFTVLEDRQRAELVAEARNRVLMRASADDAGALGQALAALLGETSDGVMLRALDDVLYRGEQLDALMRPGGADARTRVESRIRRQLGLGQGETVAALDAEILESGIPETRWRDFSDWLRSGTANDHKLADCLDGAAAQADIAVRRDLYRGLCLTKELKPRSDKQFVTKALRGRRPDLFEELVQERERLASLVERRCAAASAERSIALLTLADAVWQSYRAEKARRGVLDFADLISATRTLLDNAGAAWVHYKLDQGVDHVLVDEAQDTSPGQWEIVERLTDEFTAGHGARDTVRTVFAVGDEKQSIFGFQGAAPEMFAEIRLRYERRHAASGQLFYREPLQQSFRTARDVLAVVDAVFAQADARRGLQSDDIETVHTTARGDAPGEVQIWPLLEPDAAEDEEKPWFVPLDAVPEKSPLMRNAERIADAVKGWIEGRDALGPCAPVPEGGILVLVRNRGPLFEAILRELKARDVRVAGADRLDVGKHIATLDLLALADCLLLPGDDLALASVLKSPLFDFDDDDLMRLAPRRNGSLRRALRGSEVGKDRAAHELLNGLAREAVRLRPFDFYAVLLGAGGGRRAFRGRLGGEVDDVLDEFLRLAMSFGESETATLPGFVHWMRAAPAEIKRDLETGGSEVRVMTVHGAKGLEAKLVVLADFGAPRAPTLAPCIYNVRDMDRKEGEADLLLWSPRKKDDPDVLRLAREEDIRRDEAEHRRLLYVALTRAEDRLVIAGHTTKRTKPEGAWYTFARQAFGDAEGALPPREVESEKLGGKVLVFGTRGGEAPSIEPPAELLPLPGWLRAPVSAVSPAPAPLAPSRALDHVFTPGSVSGPIPAKERGAHLHRLLEELPRRDPARRAEDARLYLARVLPDTDEADREALAAEALALLDHPDLAPLLAAEGRAEVPVAGEVALPGLAPRLVSGSIDRLIVEPGRVLILDFKSDRPVPAMPPEAYVAQLALYRALISRIFVDRPVECALVWTASARLDHISASALDAVLPRALGMAGLP